MRRSGIPLRIAVAWSSSGVLVRVRAVAVQPMQEFDRRAQADGPGNVGRAGLELVGQRVVGGLGEGHREDHLAAALPGRHALEQLFAPVQNADAGGTEHLVAGKGVEIAAQLLHVDRHVRHGLRAVDERDDAARLGGGDQAPNRQHRARARSKRARRQTAACAASSAPRPRPTWTSPRESIGRHHQGGAGLFANHLPRHDVGVMLQMRDRGFRRRASSVGRA